MDKILFIQHWRRSSAERHGCFVYFCQFSCVFLFKTAGCHFLYFRPLWLQRGPAVVILALCVFFVVVSPKTVFIYIYTPWFEPCPAGEDWPDSCLLLHLKLLLVLCTLTFLLKLQIKIFSIFTHLSLSQFLYLLLIVFLLKTARCPFLYFWPPWFEPGPALLVLCTFTLLSKLPIIICSFF